MKFLLAPVCRPAADRIRPKAPRRLLARAAFWCGLVVLGIALVPAAVCLGIIGLICGLMNLCLKRGAGFPYK